MEFNISMTNRTSRNGDMILYQVFPETSDNEYYCVVWYCKSVNSGGTVYYNWENQYQTVWSETGKLNYGVECRVSEAMDVDPDEDNTVNFSYKDTYFFHNKTRAGANGTVNIKEDGSIPDSSTVSIGLGMGGNAILLSQARPFYTSVMNSSSELWIAFGSFKFAQTIDLSLIMNPYRIEFPFGVNSLNIVLSKNYEWSTSTGTFSNEILKYNKMLFTNKSISTEQILEASLNKNLVYNGDFLYYSNRSTSGQIVYNHPDGWIFNNNGSNSIVTFNDDLNCCQINTDDSGEIVSLSQMISEFPRWESFLAQNKVTAACLISSPVPCNVELIITDGVNTQRKGISLNSQEQRLLEVDIDVSLNPSFLSLSISTDTKNTNLFIYNVFSNIGDIAIPTLPLMVSGFIGERKQYMSTEIPPATELSLCNPMAPLSSNMTRLSSFLNGKFGTENGMSILPDMRGYFSRSWNNGANIDPDAKNRSEWGLGSVTGDQVGTVEPDQFAEHDHGLQFNPNGKVSPGTSAPLDTILKNPISKTDTEGGEETRPKNISELYTIRWA